MVILEKLKIRSQYKKLIAEVEQMKIFDGRGKGVDVYVCERCTGKVLTRYEDKGVTPYVMRCPYCENWVQHVNTISEQEARVLYVTENIKVQNWVRPPLWWLLKHKEAAEYVLNGGLVLEKEVWNETPHIYD